MMRLTCAATELVLERRSPALTHAERLRVEAHLSECEECRREHGAMLVFIALVDEKVESAAKPGVQERAIARALLKSKQPAEVALALGAAGKATSPVTHLAWGLAVAAAILLIGFGFSRGFSNQTVSGATRPNTGDRVRVGRLLAGDQPLGPGASIPERTELRAPGAVEVSLAHAELAVESAEMLRWSATERTVELRGGSVEVEVDPTRHQTFSVITPHFIVDVLGTHFRVAFDTVTVERGRVRILSNTRTPLSELGPGQTWTFEEVAAVPAGEASLVDTRVAQAVPAKSAPGPASASVPAERNNQLGVPELLARARHRLASGDASGARADIDAALASGGSRAQQAEALMLGGDCSLVQGDSSGAVRQYLQVKQRFAGSRVAETALFAAARVESNRGAKAAAKQLLLEYRKRYPKGQFRSDVETRLKALP